jgi:hypothetical protein
MSAGSTAGPGRTEKDAGKLPDLRDLGILLGWIAALILAGGLLWVLTQPVRTGLLLRAANRVLAFTQEPYRLESVIPPWGVSGRGSQLGVWYTLVNAEGRGVIFPVIINGSSVSFLAILSPEGSVDSLVPLSGNSVKAFTELSPAVRGMYIRRIEECDAMIRGALAGKGSPEKAEVP